MFRDAVCDSVSWKVVDMWAGIVYGSVRTTMFVSYLQSQGSLRTPACVCVCVCVCMNTSAFWAQTLNRQLEELKKQFTEVDEKGLRLWTPPFKAALLARVGEVHLYIYI